MKLLVAKDKSEIWLLLGLLLLVLFAYGQLVFHPFSWIDDLTYIKRNLMVKRGFTKESLSWAFTTLFYGNWCPLTWLVHMLDVELFGEWAGGHHISSLLLHILNSFLVFLFFKTATGSFGKAFCTAFLFALHPIHVEPVVWASSKKDLLSAFFGLLFLLAYLRYTRSASKLRYILCLLLYFLGLAAKSSLVPFAAILLLLDYWPLKRISFEELLNLKERFWRLLLEKLPFLLLAGIFIVLTSKAQESAGAHGLMPRITVLESLGNACFYVFSYISKTFWPVNKIGFPYPLYDFDGLTLGLFAALLILTIMALLRLGKDKPWLFGGFFWFLLGIFPYLQLQQTGHQQMADRWMYMPAAGLFIIIAWSLCPIFAKFSSSKAIKLFYILFALLISGLCFTQVSHWREPEKILRHTISISRPNYMAHVYLASGFELEDRVGEALEEAKKGLAIRLNNDSFNALLFALNRMGRAAEAIDYMKIPQYEDFLYGELQKAQIYYGAANRADARRAYKERFGEDLFELSITHARAALSLEEKNAKAQSILGAALMMLNKTTEAEKAFERLLELSPEKGSHHAYIAALYYREGKAKKALYHLERAIKLDPNNRDARVNLSALYLNLGNSTQALREAELAVEISNQEADAFVVLGNALFASSRIEEACAAFGRALSLSPRDNSALNGIAAALYKKGNYEEAVRKLKKSLEIEPNAAITHFNLGISLLELGRKKEAKRAFLLSVEKDATMKNEVDTILAKRGL